METGPSRLQQILKLILSFILSKLPGFIIRFSFYQGGNELFWAAGQRLRGLKIKI